MTQDGNSKREDGKTARSARRPVGILGLTFRFPVPSLRRETARGRPRLRSTWSSHIVSDGSALRGRQRSASRGRSKMPLRSGARLRRPLWRHYAETDGVHPGREPYRSRIPWDGSTSSGATSAGFRSPRRKATPGRRCAGSSIWCRSRRATSTLGTRSRNAPASGRRL